VAAGLIFLVFPHLFNQWRGEALSRGKEKFVTRLAFRRAKKLSTVAKKL
jgi:hypothetical protein